MVLTTSAEGAWCEFVIDGHHKLAAYQSQRVTPARLAIVRQDAPALSLAEGLAFLTSDTARGEYRRMKELQQQAAERRAAHEGRTP